MDRKMMENPLQVFDFPVLNLPVLQNGPQFTAQDDEYHSFTISSNLAFCGICGGVLSAD